MLAANQSVYARLGPEVAVTLVVPRVWRDELRRRPYPAERHPDFTGEILEVPVLGKGRPQRHVHLVSATTVLIERDAQLCLIEEEPFSLAAARWARAATKSRVRVAVQVAENLPRRLPPPVRVSTRAVLERSRFVVARSPAALARAREWGFTGDEGVLGHGVAEVITERGARPLGVVGLVGRLVPAKGVADLAEVLRAHPELRLRVAGDGPERHRLEGFGDRVEFLGALAPEQMADFYESVSVVAVPSRTTPTWSEQFGRVLVEAQARATPVVAYASGEIPWVAAETAAETVPEGDVWTLGARLAELAFDSALAAHLGERGRDLVAERFGDDALARTLGEWIARAVSRP